MMKAIGIKQFFLIGFLKSQTIACSLITVLLLIMPLNGLKAECPRPDGLGLAENSICIANELSCENGFDFFQSSKKNIRLTTLAYGGTGVLFTKIDKMPAVMTGGRGSAIFNNRYTFGGGGWGMPKGIEIGSNPDTLEFFQYGYGGLEFGYIFHEGKKVRFGSNLLTACGIGFQETFPRSEGEVKMFPVIEPSMYAQIALGELMKMDIGLTYRFVYGSEFSFVNNRQLSGPSIYIAFLVGTCNCN
jgi:hypothetical protein